MWECPIKFFSGEIQTKFEGDLLCEVSQAIGYEVDKDRLIKALNFDRSQYENGYKTGRKECLDEVCHELAELFGCPCNFSSLDEVMSESGRCADDCGIGISDDECWQRYFTECQKKYFETKEGQNGREQK